MNFSRSATAWIAMTLFLAIPATVRAQNAPASAPDERVVEAGRKKALELGYNPICAYLNDQDTISLTKGSKFTEVNGRWTLVKGDMLINVGGKPLKAGAHLLQLGEYVLGKEDGLEKGPAPVMTGPPSTRPEQPASSGPAPNPATAYRWKSKWSLPFAAESVIVKGTRGKDGETGIAAKVVEGSKGSIPTIGKDMVLDVPGSRDIRIEIDPQVRATCYAGLELTAPCVLAIADDGRVLVDKEGIVAKDGKNNQWESRKSVLAGKPIIAFFPKRRTP